MQRAAGDPLEACFWSAAAVLQARAGRAGEVNRTRVRYLYDHAMFTG